MTRMGPALDIHFEGGRKTAFLVLLPALLYGLPAAWLGSLSSGIGAAQLPILPSGIAISLLMALGWRALPGVALGAFAAGLWCTSMGPSSPVLSEPTWFLVLPLGVSAQAAVSYGLVMRITPALLDSSAPWDYTRFLLATGPIGSAVGTAVLTLSALLVSGLPYPFVAMAGATWWLLDLFAGLAISTLSLGFLSRASRPFIPFSMVSAAGTLLLGLAVVFGWFAHDATLIQVDPGLTPMQFNTALSLALCGSGLLALVGQCTRWASAVGSLLVLIAGITLSQYITGVDIGIDELFVDHFITVNTTFPGRMAPNTALCFILFGISLWQPHLGRWGTATSSTLCSIVASLGFVTLVSYVAGIDSAYSWGRMTPMAVHTAAGFLVLGLGGIALEVVQTEGQRRRVSFSPLPTGVALAATSLWVWQAVYHDEQTKIRDLVQNQAQEIARLIDMEITYHNHALNRMAARWELTGGTDKTTWTADAQAHLRDFQTVAAIAWADEESRVRWLEPLAGNEEIIGFDLTSHPQGRAVLARVRETGMQASTDALNVSRIGQGFIVISPVLRSGEIAGYLVGLYRLDRLFDVLSAATRESYRYRVWEGENLIFESDTAPWPEGPGSEEPVSGEMRDGTWRLQLLPRPVWLASQRSNLPILILFAGLILSAATTIALHLLEAVQRQYEVIQWSEKRLRQIIDSAPTGMITVDRVGTICDVNPAAQSQFGYDTKDLVGQPLEAFVPGAMLGTQQAGFRQGALLKAFRPSGEIQERSALKRNGVTFPVEIALAPFESRDGVQVLVLITDITERDEARRRLEAHTRELESTNRDLDDFAYVASHDLRAPLTAIASLVHWIEEDTATLLPPGSAKHLALIKNRVGRMGKLLEDLLDYSRAGRTANETEFVDMAEMVSQVTDLVRGAAPVTIRTQGLPAFETVRTPLHQVMRNLISNSIKHHDGDGCLLEISATEQGAFYVFRVADDGPGIPRQFHKKVFNMFQTLRPRDEVEGSGMGLALVRKVVERYGGYVQLIESDGRGTTVEFTWPKANMEG